MAMGLQTTAARKLNVAGISTTVLTSTLANLFDLAQRISHREKRKAPIEHVSFMRIGSIVFYCLGLCFSGIHRHSTLYHHLGAYLYPWHHCDNCFN
ncbi:DUF1275 family protein [Bacillus sp. SL00103]